MEKWNPGEMGAIVAPTRQMIINVILPEMRELGFLERWEHKSSHSDEPGLHSPNGSRALLLSADNQRTIERLRGLNLAWWHIDEKTAVPRRAQEILEQRLRVGNYRNGYITTTPKGKDDTYEFFVGGENPDKKSFNQSTIYETDDKMAIVGVPTSANPHTPEDYKDAMESDMPDQIRAQEVEGRFVEIGSGVFTREMFDLVPPDAPHEDATLQTIIGVDPAATVDSQAAEANDADYWGVCVVQVDSFRGEIYVTDVKRKRGMTLSEGVNWVSQIARNANSPKVFVESNQAQVYLQNALKDAGVNAIPIKTTSNKENKLVDLTIPLSDGTVKLIDWGDDVYNNLIDEALTFPEGSHDDLLDALHLAVDNTDVSWGTQIIGGDMYNRES
jgi:phage terminase large subunit-like protein